MVLYYISVKLFCPPVEKDQYLSSFWSGDYGSAIVNFFIILKDNLLGKAYYGEILFVLVPILISLLTLKFLWAKNCFYIDFNLNLFVNFSFSYFFFFITNGYHPPRLYVSSNLIFSFLIVFQLNLLK